MIKVTFTLNDETVKRLRRLGQRLGRPQSQVVRESIKQYEAPSDKLSDEEQRRMAAATLIHLDTSLLVDALTGVRRSEPALRQATLGGERLAISVVVLFEWLR